MTVSVLLIDDHPVVRSGLRAVLEGAGLQVVAEAATGEQAVELAAQLQPRVALCDLRLGEGIDGITTTAQLRALPSPPAVLILTTFDRDAEVLGAISAGAAGYLLKEADPAEIVEAITRVAAGELVLSQELTARVLDGVRKPVPQLTEREREVLQLLATGIPNRELAQRLFVSEATVKTHLVHIFTKLGVDSRARAIHVAQSTGLL